MRHPTAVGNEGLLNPPICWQHKHRELHAVEQGVRLFGDILWSVFVPFFSMWRILLCALLVSVSVMPCVAAGSFVCL